MRIALFGFLLFCLLALSPAIGSGSESEPSARISLESAIFSAISNNPQMTAAKSRLDASLERSAQARSGFFPQINAVQNYQRTTNPMLAFGMKLNQEMITQRDFNPQVLNNPSPMENFASQVLMTWPLYDSGQTWYSWRQADLACQSEQSWLDRTRQEVIAKAVAAYTDFVFAGLSAAVVDQAISTALAHLEMIEKKYENGLAVKSDVLRTQVHIAELEQDKVTADSRVSVAQAALNAVMGADMSASLSPETPLAQTSMEAKDLNEWVETALADRPDLAGFYLQEQMAEAQIDKSKSAYLPTVSLNGGYEVDTNDYENLADNYTVGANVTLNLFSGGKNLSGLREAAFKKQEIRANVQSLKQQIRLETEQAYRDVAAAEKRISAAKLSVKQSDEALRIIRNRYESGLIPLVSLLDAELTLYRSNNNYNQALKDHVQARARLLLAVGKLDESFK